MALGLSSVFITVTIASAAVMLLWSIGNRLGAFGSINACLEKSEQVDRNEVELGQWKPLPTKDIDM